MSRRMRVPVLTAMVLLSSVAAACGQKPSVVPKQPQTAASPAFDDFGAKLKEYAELRARAEKELKPLPERANPTVIEARRTQLAEAVQAARTGAREGDFFTAGVRSQIATIIASEMRGPDGKPARDAAKQGNPKFETDGGAGPIKIAVNGKYPESAPKSAMPPTLLLRLPKLPDEVQFRFVGADLVLLDLRTGLVVDVFRRAAPGLATAKR